MGPEKQSLSAEELEALCDKPGVESLSEHLDRVDMYVGVIERSRLNPGSKRERLARIGLAHSYGVMIDLGYLSVVMDDIEQIVRNDSGDDSKHNLKELRRALNLRVAGNSLLSDCAYTIPDPSGLENGFISKAEVAEQDYWSTLRKVFKF